MYAENGPASMSRRPVRELPLDLRQDRLDRRRAEAQLDLLAPGRAEAPFDRRSIERGREPCTARGRARELGPQSERGAIESSSCVTDTAQADRVGGHPAFGRLE